MAERYRIGPGGNQAASAAPVVRPVYGERSCAGDHDDGQCDEIERGEAFEIGAVRKCLGFAKPQGSHQDGCGIGDHQGVERSESARPPQAFPQHMAYPRLHPRPRARPLRRSIAGKPSRFSQRDHG